MYSWWVWQCVFVLHVESTFQSPALQYVGEKGTCTMCTSAITRYIHIVRLRLPLYFPNRFYIPNPCILGTRPVLPCKNVSRGMLELVGTKSVFVLWYSCYLSSVGCSQVELSYQLSWIAVVPTVLEKSVFFGYLTAVSVSVGLFCSLLFSNS